jgi:parallel beta-helix repeat protein
MQRQSRFVLLGAAFVASVAAVGFVGASVNPSTTATVLQTVPPTDPSTLPTGQAFARTFYVAPNGKDSGPGTLEQPWGTLQHAVDNLKAGDRALVGSGEYNNGLYFENKDGEPGRPITIAAAPGAKPVVRLKNLQQYGVVIKGSSYVTVEGLEFSYEGPDASAANGERFEAGISVQTTDRAAGLEPKISHHIQIRNNNVHGFPDAGINIIQSDYVLAEGNTVWNNSKWSKYDTSGISVYESVALDAKPGAHTILRNNTVFQNENRIADPAFGYPTDGNCIIIDDNRRTQDKLPNKTNDGAYEADTLVENNMCAGNGGSGVSVFNSDNVLVRHNSLYNNQRTAAQNGAQLSASFYAAAGSTSGKQVPVRRGNNRFVNNVVVWDTSVEAAGTPASAGALFATDDPLDAKSAVFVRNLYFGSLPVSPKSGVLSSVSPSDIVSGTMPFTKPNVMASAGDFSLLSSSGGIDAANANDSPATDLLGTPRPGASSDLGALERKN